MFRTDNITDQTWKDADETTDRTTPAYAGNIARYNGTDWYFFYNLRSLIEALARTAVPAGNADGGITIGATFPTGISSGHVHLLTTDNTAITFVNTAGESVTAMAGDFTHYDGTKWELLFRTKSLITASTAIGLTARNFGTTFPTSPKVGEVFILLQDIPSGIAYKHNVNAGSDEIVRNAERGQVFEYQEGPASNPDFWVLQGNINPPPIIPFKPQFIGDDWERISSKLIGTQIAVYYADSDEVIIANNGVRGRLLAVQPGHGLVFEDFGDDVITTFIVSSVDADDNRWVRYTGRWTRGVESVTAQGDESTISHIPHNVDMTEYVDPSKLSLREASFGTSLPDNPRPNETFVFLDNTTTDPTWVDITGSPQGAAFKGDVAQYVVLNNVFQWVYFGNISIGGGISTDALDALRTELQAQIALINNPISTHQLLASSKITVDARYNQFNRVDVDWALEEGIPDGFEADDDNLYISREYRGYISVETWEGNTLRGKKLLEVSDEQASESVVQDIGSRGSMGRFNWLLLAVIHNNVNVHQLSIQSESANQAMFSGLQFRVYAEVAVGSAEIKRDLDAVTARVGTAETDIDAVESAIENIPVSADVLWATSKAFTAGFGQGRLDTNWVLADNTPTGVAADGDFINIPKSIRGDLHIDVENASGVLLEREVMPIVIGEGRYGEGVGSWLRTRIIQHSSDPTLLRFDLYVTGSQTRTFPSGSTVKVYAVSALPRNQVTGVTRAELDAEIAKINDFYIDITPRYAFMRTSGSTPDDLDGNFVFVFSHVPEEYADANVVEINFQGIQAFRGGWTPSTTYIRFGFEPTSLNNLRNNTGRNQATWQIEITFFNGTTNLGSERTFVVINRG